MLILLALLPDGLPWYYHGKDPQKLELEIGNDIKYLYSTNYPKNYENNENYAKIMSVPKGASMKITFHDFDIENHQDCGWDYVQLCDENGNCQDKICGSSLPLKLTIETSTAVVYFHSDGSVTRKGFKLSYQGDHVNGGWSGWGKCTKSCGGGLKRRSCTNPMPEKGGAYCTGNNLAECNKNIRCDSDDVTALNERQALVLKRAWCFFMLTCSNAKYYKSCCTLWQPYCGGLSCGGSTGGKEQDPCRPGWATLKTGCYRIVNAKTFNQAREFCEDEDGFLVEINNQEEQNELSQFYKDSDITGQVWLGANKTEGEWRWIYSQEKIGFNSWGTHIPNNEDCLLWDGNQSWKYTFCNKQNTGLKAICEAVSWQNSSSPKNPNEGDIHGNEDLSVCECGIANSKNKRIVQGKEAEKNEYPWQVALVSGPKNRIFCGGSLISTRVVLSAAHCTYIKQIKEISVMVGEHDVNITEVGEEKIGVQDIIHHVLYDPKTLDYDLSLLYLVKSIKWSEHVTPVCLPTSNVYESYYESYEGVKATVSGWGTTQNIDASNTLQKANVFTMKNDVCKTKFKYNATQITDNMICAANNGKDACNGDSGGPLVTQESGGFYSIIGVVSFGADDCGDPDYPGVYSRVNRGLIEDWIKENMLGATCHQSVLWIGSMTFNLPDFTRTTNLKCEIASPSTATVDLASEDTFSQTINGITYICNHVRCVWYKSESNEWRRVKYSISASKFKERREDAATTVIGGKWIVQSGTTAEVWTPNLVWPNWPEGGWNNVFEYDSKYNSPFPVTKHCIVNVNGTLMQIGGETDAGPTNKCYLDGMEVASMKQFRSGHTCIFFKNKVWVAGGSQWPLQGNGSPSSCEYGYVAAYDIMSDTWDYEMDFPRIPQVTCEPRPGLVVSGKQLYYIGTYSGKIFKLDNDKWVELMTIDKLDNKRTALVMKKYC